MTVPAVVAITKEAAQGRALVAGDLTTTGQPLEPVGDLSYHGLYDIYCQQIEALAKAGVDLLVAETLLCVGEAMAAVDAARAVCDLPILCSLTVSADGAAIYGGTAVEAMETLQEMGASAVGINCSVGPDQLEAVVRSMCAAAKVPVLVKPNAGIPAINDRGEAIYDMSPADFARHMKKLAELGAKVLGGCCGTDPDYIRLLSETVRQG